MDFSKLRSGAIDFSVFITTHLILLSITVYSFWGLLGPDLSALGRQSAEYAVMWLEEPTVVSLLDTYALRPIIPALAVFVAIFILHVHQQGLQAIGKYTPPALVWDHIPALREWDGMNWLSVQHQLGGELNYYEVLRVITQRYDALVSKSRWPCRGNYQRTFDTFKAFAMLNIALLLIALFEQRGGGTNALLAVVFATLAAARSIVAAYHNLVESRWTLREVVNQIAEESPLKSSRAIPDFGLEAVQQSKREADEMASRYENRRRVSFDWTMPIVGSLSVLRLAWHDSLFDHRRKQLRTEQRLRHQGEGDTRGESSRLSRTLQSFYRARFDALIRRLDKNVS